MTTPDLKALRTAAIAAINSALTNSEPDDIKSKLITDYDSIPVIVDDHHVFEGHTINSANRYI